MRGTLLRDPVTVRVLERIAFVTVRLTIMSVVLVIVIVIVMIVLVRVLDPIEVFVNVQVGLVLIALPL